MLKKLFLTVWLVLLLPGLLFAELGDANGDNEVTILDALVVAQHYVGLDPQPFMNVNSDVNGDNKKNIIDSLQIAQHYVGTLAAFPAKDVQLPVFESEKEFIAAFENTRQRYTDYWMGPFPVDMFRMTTFNATFGVPVSAPAPAPEGGKSSDDFSTTNVQVKGVDEADIIKTDGNFVYMLAKGELIIADAYPAEEALIYSRTPLKGINPLEMFINGDTLLVFATAQFAFTDTPSPVVADPQRLMLPVEGYYYYPSYTSFVTVKLFDISSRKAPRLLKQVDVEGNYLSSRKIGDYAYFVINSYPNYRIDLPVWQDLVPMYRETTDESDPQLKDMQPVAPYNEIGYIEPIQAQQFITVASISMADPAAPVNRQTMIGSGNEIYASLQNLYIAQQSWRLYSPVTGDTLSHYTEKTYITKMAIAEGKIKYAATGSVKGHILNQFSMDEFDNHFRIATTYGDVWNRATPSTNNVYVLDTKLKQTGAVENLAPGESIYSVRFTGKRGYLVTYIKIDPLFVIDLADHTNPSVLGKLKIPGYSDYLHPYDENHIIGIGKNTAGGTEFFSWYQGIKLALFDVTDVNKPVEMYTESIGHRGTDSEALHNHKAFLFDREKNLLCIPITLAEIEGEPTSDSQYGKVTFQGAFVYDLSLENGFRLKGRLTHHDNFADLQAKGYYFGRTSAIRRSLYIDNILYTFSENRLQGNDMETLKRLLALDL